MEKLSCSLKECGKTILGNAVILAEEEKGSVDWGDDTDVYHGRLTPDDREQTTWIALHPNCFHVLFDEVLRQEHMLVLLFVAGPVREIREGLGMN